MAKRKVSNLLALAVLSYLSRGPMHPYELGQMLRQNADDRSIRFNHGSLYMVIKQLAKADFIAAQGSEREGGRPERTIYAITDEGRAEMSSWLRELIEVPRYEYPSFIAALSLIGALAPDDALELLGNRLERLQRARAEVRTQVEESLAAGLHPLFLVEEDYRAALLDADLAFVEDLIARIADPADGWLPAWRQMHAAATSEDRQET
jgi:DNA-binding PadR family transcriptional regulator